MLTIDGKSATPLTVKYHDEPHIRELYGIGYVEKNEGDYVLVRFVPGATMSLSQEELNDMVDYLIPWRHVIWVQGR